MLCCGFFLLGAAACQPPLSHSELVALAAGEQRWAARGFADYSFEIIHSCFCGGELTQWARVEVVDGQVRRVTLVSTGEVITDHRMSFWPTVEKVFRDIHLARNSDGLADVQFTLDRTLGYPSFVQWSYGENILDAGGTQSLRNAAPLPVP